MVIDLESPEKKTSERPKKQNLSETIFKTLETRRISRLNKEKVMVECQNLEVGIKTKEPTYGYTTSDE